VGGRGADDLLGTDFQILLVNNQNHLMMALPNTVGGDTDNGGSVFLYGINGPSQVELDDVPVILSGTSVDQQVGFSSYTFDVSGDGTQDMILSDTPNENGRLLVYLLDE